MIDMEKIRRLWSEWTIGKMIGEGSFGAVYEMERKIGEYTEKAALKVLSIPQKQSDITELRLDGHTEASIYQRFESYWKHIISEYKTMAELKGHTNIVYCDDLRYLRHEDGIGWDITIKMELLTSLPNHLAGRSTVDDQTVIDIGVDICKALSICRANNIIHRDIKPQNIFVSKDGNYKLGDFGIAKTTEGTASGTRTGTDKYMAPEVYNNQSYGASVDIYSLGLVLYRLLNERRGPFLPLGTDTTTFSEEQQASDRRFAGETLPAPAHGSDELKAIILKACAFLPADRYASPEEMQTELLKLKSVNTDNEVILSPDDPGVVPDDESPEKADQEKTDNHKAFEYDGETQGFWDQTGVKPEPNQKWNKKYLYSAIAAIAMISIIILFTLTPDQSSDDTKQPEIPGMSEPSTAAEPIWSEWMDELPAKISADEYIIETKMQYRSSPAYVVPLNQSPRAGYSVYYTDYTEYGSFGEWQNEPIEANDLVQVKTRTQYQYTYGYYWRPNASYPTSTPKNVGTGVSDTYLAKGSKVTVGGKSYTVMKEPTAVVQYAASYRSIRKHACSTGGWTAFSDKMLIPSDSLAVNTRVLYRYIERSDKETTAPTLKNFRTSASYSGAIQDVKSDAWYSESMILAADLGFYTPGEYMTLAPLDNTRLADVLVVAVKMHRTYHGIEGELTPGTVWYHPYVEYAIENGIISNGEFSNYMKEATRQEAAYILNNVFPQTELPRIHVTPAFTDVDASSKFSVSVYVLADAGVFSVSNDLFRPNDSMTRAELATIIQRMVYPNARV